MLCDKTVCFPASNSLLLFLYLLLDNNSLSDSDSEHFRFCNVTIMPLIPNMSFYITATLIHAYQKPVTVQFPDKRERQNGVNKDDNGALVWYTDSYKTNKALHYAVGRYIIW
jgi:hypothetical protein